MFESRKNCVYCDGKNHTNICKIEKMPIFMGSIEKPEDYLFSDMTFISCDNCNSIFLREIIDPNILYKNNHNRVIVGETWKNHYTEFVNFIGDVDGKNIIEIGDPSLKVAKFLLNNCGSYSIIEPNPDIDNEKVNVINQYFDENFETNLKYDLVINSHFMEHVFNPIKSLIKMNQILDKNGELIFSVPNLQYLLENNFYINNILQFEHTYFYSTESMSNLLNRCGFELVEVNNYLNHSIFYKCVKSDKISDFEYFENKKYKKKFLDIWSDSKNKIKLINEMISLHPNNNIYLFGCHVSSQFLLSNGLFINRVKNILDNSIDKNGKYLYGYHLKTESPDAIIGVETPIIICSHMSVYFDEIKNQL